MTIDAFLKLYENDMRPRLKENTWLSKEHMIRTKLLPTFGKKMLSEIETRDIIAWQNELLAYRDEKKQPYSLTYLKSILQAQLNKIVDNMRQNKHIDLDISEQAFAVLKAKAVANLDNGGRSIGNIVESMFVNPLSRYMYDHKLLRDCRIVISDILTDAMPCTVVCA